MGFMGRLYVAGLAYSLVVLGLMVASPNRPAAFNFLIVVGVTLFQERMLTRHIRDGE